MNSASIIYTVSIPTFYCDIEVITFLGLSHFEKFKLLFRKILELFLGGGIYRSAVKK